MHTRTRAYTYTYSSPCSVTLQFVKSINFCDFLYYIMINLYNTIPNRFQSPYNMIKLCIIFLFIFNPFPEFSNNWPWSKRIIYTIDTRYENKSTPVLDSFFFFINIRI
jgi:hypothetical protein